VAPRWLGSPSPRKIPSSGIVKIEAVVLSAEGTQIVINREFRVTVIILRY
jgi:hypothetical protein